MRSAAIVAKLSSNRRCPAVLGLLLVDLSVSGQSNAVTYVFPTNAMGMGRTVRNVLFWHRSLACVERKRSRTNLVGLPRSAAAKSAGRI
jgi:hypothetical protein